MKYKFNFSYIKYSLLFGLPVLPSMFSSFGLAFADRLMINNMTNTIDVGIYSFAFMVAMLIQVVIGAVGKSWQPMFYKALSINDFTILDKTFILNSRLVLSASLFLILFSYEFIFVLANKNYMDAQIIIIYLVIGFNFFFLYTIFSQYNSYAKKTYIDSIITFIVVSLNIVLNYIFIPIYGYVVSAITTIISYFTMFLLFYISSKYILKYKVVDIFSAWKIYLFYIVLLIIFFTIESFKISYFLLLNIKIIIISLFLYYNFGNKIINYIKAKNV
jgi:O-antigen/teichoic acid export membrane protein